MQNLIANDALSAAQLAHDAANSLRRIARNESIKEVVQQQRLVHDALLDVAMRYIGGETLDDCCAIARQVNAKGDTVTIDFMGENTRDEVIARDAAGEFHRVLAAIQQCNIAGSISLDLTHLGMAVDPELAFSLSSALADAASEAGLEMVISAEGSERTDDVIQMYERLSERFANVGITLQAYLFRTTDDLERVLTRPGKIRIVKGAFEEPASLALSRGDVLNDRFVAMVERILATGSRLSIASHDLAVLDRIMSTTSPSEPNAEIEMLYGVQPHRLEAVRASGYATRVYLPFGRDWFLYVCHRLAEYPPNIYRAIEDAVRRWDSLTADGSHCNDRAGV